MSLYVVLSSRPTVDDYEQLVPEGLRLSLKDRPNAERYVVHRGDQPLFTVEGPYVRERGDLGYPMERLVANPRFMLSIDSFEQSGEDGYAAATQLAKAICSKRDGAVYDVERETLIWTKLQPHEYVEVPKCETITELELQWFISLDAKINTPKVLLNTLRRLYPEALPNRYDHDTCMQHRLKEGGDDQFVTFWNRLAKDDNGEYLLWSAAEPATGGIVDFSTGELPENCAAYLLEAKNCLEVSISFDAGPIRSSPQDSDRIVKLFRVMARELDAFHALASLLRGVSKRFNRLSYGKESEYYPRPHGSLAGLTPEPTWLAWYGAPYFDLLTPACKGHPLASQDGLDAWFVRSNETPQHRGELDKSSLPKIPERLQFQAQSKKHESFHSWASFLSLETTLAQYVPPFSAAPSIDRQ